MKRRIRQDQRPVGIEQAKLLHDQEDRNQSRMNRNQHPQQKRAVSHPAQLKLKPGQKISGQRSEKHGYDQGGESNNDAV
ncbi:hypothetical protein D1872_307030 [compost metagenome]